MTVFLEIDPRYSESSDLPEFRACVETVFKDQGIPLDSDVSIALLDDEGIHKLNLDFLGQDKPTDVLVFPAGHIDPDSGHINLGDVIISYPRAEAQSESHGHRLSSELSLLTVHGVLHLLGFDHDNPESEAKMWQAQSAILDQLGIEIDSPHYSTDTGD